MPRSGIGATRDSESERLAGVCPVRIEVSYWSLEKKAARVSALLTD